MNCSLAFWNNLNEGPIPSHVSFMDDGYQLLFSLAQSDNTSTPTYPNTLVCLNVSYAANGPTKLQRKVLKCGVGIVSILKAYIVMNTSLPVCAALPSSRIV